MKTDITERNGKSDTMDISRGSLAVWRKTLYRDASVAADQEEGREGDGQRA